MALTQVLSAQFDISYEQSKMPYITTLTEKLHYHQSGTGPRILLAFPGYGGSAAMFAVLDQYLGTDFTILSFDLPHHAQSQWPTGQQLTQAHLSILIDKVKQQFSVSTVSLIGYSIGGRICLNIATTAPASISKIILLAPDGMQVNPYYFLLTRTIIGKAMFSHMLHQSSLYLSAIALALKLHIIGVSKHKFIMQAIGTHEGRMQLLKVWPCLSPLIISSSKIKAIIQQHNIPVCIFMGAYDKVIPISLAKKFKKGMTTVELNILEKGHRLLNKETAPLIAAGLL